MYNKIKLDSTSTKAVVCILPCMCIVNISQMDVSKVVKRPIYIFDYILLSFLWMRNVSDRSCRGNQTHVLCSGTFFKKIVPFMTLCGKILWGSAGHRWQYNMVHAHCMLDTLGYKLHLQYVMLIDFLLQQWLDERTSVIRYMYVTCLAYICLFHAHFLV
jgi:hypothetical protein